jgi:cation transport protein ChaC
MSDDPFRHHPGLRDLITPRSDSRFADFRVDDARVLIEAQGLPTDWLLPEAAREADRAATLKGRMDRDLWVFGYGSLIWDPGVHFSEVRRAFAPGVARRFILRDTGGGRGTEEAPGVMAALDAGEGCHGVVFRIPLRHLEAETYSLWSRERIGRAYRSAFLPVETAHGEVEALAFLADHAADNIWPDLSHEEQVRCAATGEGFLGSSLDYVENLARHFDELGIEDAEVTRLLADARAFAATQG